MKKRKLKKSIKLLISVFLIPIIIYSSIYALSYSLLAIAENHHQIASVEVSK